MKFFASVLCLFALGCVPNPDTPLHSVVPGQDGAETNHRISIKRIGVVDDPLAYNYRRGIYVIHDNETGKEFIGVSGVGITETGSHGKHRNQDER